MSVEDFDKDALKNLTDEERAAIEDQNYSPEELASMKAVAGAPDDDGNDEDGGADEIGTSGSGEPGGIPGAVPGELKNKIPSEESPHVERDDVNEGGAAVDTREFVPQYQAKLPEDFEGQVSALKEETRALAQKFRDGEVEFDDYQTQLDVLNARRDELAEFRVKASIAEDMSAQSIGQKWQFTVDRFTDVVARDEGINYRADAEKQADLDLFVKVLAANPKNADKDFDWFLSEAHKRVKTLHGIIDKPDQEKPKNKPSRATPTIPETLALVPGGDGIGDVGGEFADLDALEGEDLERAIAKMSPAQRERYVRGD